MITEPDLLMISCSSYIPGWMKTVGVTLDEVGRASSAF